MPDELRERILDKCAEMEKSERSGNGTYTDHVFTVERAQPHRIRRVVSGLAACAVLAGGLGATGVFLHRQGSGNIASEVAQEACYVLCPFGDFTQRDYVFCVADENDEVHEYENNAELADLLNKFNWVEETEPFAAEVFFFINLLCPEKKEDINIEDMKTYQKHFIIRNISFCPTLKQITYEKNEESKNNYFSNSTFIVYNGESIIKYRKSSYADEKYNIGYYFGFGNMIILKDNEISRKLINLIDIFICMDLTVRSYFPLIKRLKFDFSLDKDNLEIANNIKTLLIKNNKNEGKKKIIIVQSNSINVNDNLDIADDNSIFIQVDPNATFVTKFSYTEFLKTKIENINKKIKVLDEKLDSEVKGKNERYISSYFTYYNSYLYLKKLLSNNIAGISKKIEEDINIVAENKYLSINFNLYMFFDNS